MASAVTFDICFEAFAYGFFFFGGGHFVDYAKLHLMLSSPPQWEPKTTASLASNFSPDKVQNRICFTPLVRFHVWSPVFSCLCHFCPNSSQNMSWVTTALISERYVNDNIVTFLARSDFYSTSFGHSLWLLHLTIISLLFMKVYLSFASTSCIITVILLFVREQSFLGNVWLPISAIL
jgi:hypothetical protein